MQKARRHPLRDSDRLQAYSFRVYFTPLFRVLFTFPSQYSFTIGLSGVFSLTRWFWQIQTGFHMSRPTQDTARYTYYFLYGTITLYGQAFQLNSNIIYKSTLQSYNPATAETITVWAISRSLATTQEITIVFFSCAYLDVSVRRVCLPYGISGLQPDGLPHSEIYGSKDICSSPQLIAAYHVFLRL